MNILLAALTPIVNLDGQQVRDDVLYSSIVITKMWFQGWEELVDAAVTHLLRTTLAKSTKDQQPVLISADLELSADSHKLKKHIALLCDRISKGFLPSGKGHVEVRMQIGTYFMLTCVTLMAQATRSLTTGTPIAGPEEGSTKTVGSLGFVSSMDITSGPAAAGYRKHNSIGHMPALLEQASEESIQ